MEELRSVGVQQAPRDKGAKGKNRKINQRADDAAADDDEGGDRGGAAGKQAGWGDGEINKRDVQADGSRAKCQTNGRLGDGALGDVVGRGPRLRAKSQRAGCALGRCVAQSSGTHPCARAPLFPSRGRDDEARRGSPESGCGGVWTVKQGGRPPKPSLPFFPNATPILRASGRSPVRRDMNHLLRDRDTLRHAYEWREAGVHVVDAWMLQRFPCPTRLRDRQQERDRSSVCLLHIAQEANTRNRW